MRPDDEGPLPSAPELEKALAALASPAPADFRLRVLRRAGIARDRYDSYVRVDTDAGGLYVAFGPHAVTGAMLETMVTGPDGFEELHRSRTRRTAIRATTPFPGLRTAVRTGRAKNLAIDMGHVGTEQRAVLDAVRTVPKGQLRPVSWIAREAGLDRERGERERGERECEGGDIIGRALAANPAVLLIPCHRITGEDGTPCDAAYPPGTGEALRATEGIDMTRLAELARRGAFLLGSATTHIYCHPTCAHARRITPRHQRPFHNASEARQAGYRACRSCRPLTA
ncbi:Ada metal-binding domain-containing protein [Streptomyces monashensis]|uniref:Cysteine methyltransferase n=1 Tax=Streptomyces monashensis TaxID=1678012 RepID=A0A1S2PT89_9ACTN|nr:Ada metal-binding domain-containing protein [Streptomyces monashensis]OIJ97031.1 cysteine methyltransferase [Streptomyces monashensis]